MEKFEMKEEMRFDWIDFKYCEITSMCNHNQFEPKINLNLNLNNSFKFSFSNRIVVGFAYQLRW